jgi:hypothetical protein
LRDPAYDLRKIWFLGTRVNRACTLPHRRPRTFAGSGVAHSGILMNRKVSRSQAQTNSRGGQRGVLPLGSGRGCGPEIPWVWTRWQAREPVPYWVPMRVLGGVVLLAGLIALVGAFVRFVVEGLGTPAPVAAPERLGRLRGVSTCPQPHVGGGTGGHSSVRGSSWAGSECYCKSVPPGLVVAARSCASTRNRHSPEGLGRGLRGLPPGVRCLPGCPACVPANPASSTN